jgi:hypothetical protein
VAAGARQVTTRPTVPGLATARTATPSPAPSQPSGEAASQPPAQYGNPDGHFPVPAAGQAVSTAHPDHVIGSGTPASCTSAAVGATVALGGIITFDCGPSPVTITMTATAQIVHGSLTVIGGGAIFVQGGQLTVVNSDFSGNGCYQYGPDLGGGAIRGYGMDMSTRSASPMTPSPGTSAPTAARSAACTPTSS